MQNLRTIRTDFEKLHSESRRASLQFKALRNKCLRSCSISHDKTIDNAHSRFQRVKSRYLTEGYKTHAFVSLAASEVVSPKESIARKQEFFAGNEVPVLPDRGLINGLQGARLRRPATAGPTGRPPATRHRISSVASGQDESHEPEEESSKVRATKAKGRCGSQLGDSLTGANKPKRRKTARLFFDRLSQNRPTTRFITYL